MADLEGGSSKANQDIASIQADASTDKDLEKLPPEMRTAATIIAGFFRSTSGPDPDIAKAIAESEMHAEDCKLQAYKASLESRHQQGERDHAYRNKKLNHDTLKSLIVGTVSAAGVICGLYLMTSGHNTQVGTPLLVASFMALLGVRPGQGRDKD